MSPNCLVGLYSLSFIRTFKFDDLVAVLSYLEHLLVSPPGDQNTKEILQKAEAAAISISNPDKLVEHLSSVLHKVQYTQELVTYYINEDCSVSSLI